MHVSERESSTFQVPKTIQIIQMKYESLQAQGFALADFLYHKQMEIGQRMHSFYSLIKRGWSAQEHCNILVT